MAEVSDSRTLADDWREQVRVHGKRAFENEEMLRLGFLTLEDLDRAAQQDVTREQYVKAMADLDLANQELRRIETELADLQDVEKAIGEIRTRRIERVKAAAKVKRAAKAVQRAERAAQFLERRRTAPTFLGRGVSNQLDFTPSGSTVLSDRGLPMLQSFTDLSNAVNLAPEKLQWLSYERTAGSVDHYSRFEIPKRSGGMRLISSPKPTLRATQQWIRESILSSQRLHPAAMAFRPGVSIVDNATIHAGSAIVVRIDLKDFFPSITFPRVRGFFHSLGYNSGVSTVLALLCTDAPRVRMTKDEQTHIVAVGERSLPQGAVTSPDLANLIANKLDRRLQGLADKAGWTYTRYADDLVFSTSDPDSAPHRLVRAVTSISSDEGFLVNAEKTRIMRSPNRQMVTGLLVNDQVRLTRRDLRRIRSFLHHCDVDGVDQVSVRIGKDARAVARGYYAYVHMVSPTVARRLREHHPWV